MKKFFLIAGVCLMAAACNPQKDNNPITNVKEAFADTKLQGKHFFADCSISGLAATAVQFLPSKRVSLKFEGANVTRSTAYYDNAKCEGHAAYILQEIGQIDVMKDKKTQDGGQYIDMKFNKLNVEIGSQKGADAANRLNMCGESNWTPGQKREMTQVAANATCLNKKLETEKQVYAVDGSVLYMGNLGLTGALARDNDGRPTQLDRNNMKFVEGK